MIKLGIQDFINWKNFYCRAMVDLNLLDKDLEKKILDLPMEYRPERINDVFCKIEFNPSDGHTPKRMIIRRDPDFSLNGVEPYITQLKIAHEIGHIQARLIAEKAKIRKKLPRNYFSYTKRAFRNCFKSEDPVKFVRAFLVWFTMRSLNESIADFLSIACFRQLKDTKIFKRLTAAEYRSGKFNAVFGLQRSLMLKIREKHLARIEQETKKTGEIRPLIIKEIRAFFRNPVVNKIYDVKVEDDNSLLYDTFFEDIGSRGLHLRWIKDFWEWIKQWKSITDFSAFAELLLTELTPAELFYAPLSSYNIDNFAQRILNGKANILE